MKIILFLLEFLGLYHPQSVPTPTVIPTIVESKYSYPIDNFSSRITKKPFGIYITPKNSPVTPERFSGYHTAVDIEYEDVESDVPVYSIADGQVIFSGTVNGYGGIIAIQYPEFIGIYGHLRPSSLLSVNTTISRSQQIAVLGRGYTTETSGERKHLHFAILKESKLDFRGYVQSQSQLSPWLNPLDLYQ